MVVMISDMVSRCLQAESKTKDRSKIPETIDWAMGWPAVRCAILCTMLPPLCYPDV